MKLALADKPAMPFRVPAGIKLIRVDAKTGMRAGPGDGGRTILEAFKPGTAPPDNYSVIGVADADGRPLIGVAGRRPQHHASRHRRACTDAWNQRDTDVALCGARRYIPCTSSIAACAADQRTMRAEVERLVEEIKQSVGLLRRHL